MVNNIKIEVCCGSINDCIIAEKCNADRIELNQALELGGLTPSVATLTAAKKYTSIPICCMVKPRHIGSCYTEEEFEVIIADAKNLIAHGADGIVFGFLNSDGTIDEERTRKMVETIHPKEAIFNKTFDTTEDLEKSLQILIDCGVDRVLTMGGSIYPDLEVGCKILGELIEKYGTQIEILPGGGVQEHNVQEILSLTKANQIHMTAKYMASDPSRSLFRTKHEATEYFAVSESNLKAIMKKIAEFQQ
jgi:Uncharacterized protein involved in copper resistance